MSLGCKDIWIRKSKFVAKTQFFCQSLPIRIVFGPRLANFHNFNKPTIGQYSVVRGATLDTYLNDGTSFKKKKLSHFLVCLQFLEKLSIKK